MTLLRPSDLAVYAWLASLPSIDVQRKYLLARSKAPKAHGGRGSPVDEAVHLSALARCIHPPTPLPAGGFVYELEGVFVAAPHLDALSILQWTETQDVGAPVANEWLGIATHPAFAAPLQETVETVARLPRADSKPWWVAGHGLGGALAQGLSIYLARAYGRSLLGVHTFGAPQWTVVESREVFHALSIPLTSWILRCDPLPHTSTQDVYAHPAVLSWLYGREPLRAPHVHDPDTSDRIWFGLLCTSDQLRGPIGDHALEGYYRALRNVEGSGE